MEEDVSDVGDADEPLLSTRSHRNQIKIQVYKDQRVYGEVGSLEVNPIFPIGSIIWYSLILCLLGFPGI